MNHLAEVIGGAIALTRRVVAPMWRLQEHAVDGTGRAVDGDRIGVVGHGKRILETAADKVDV